MIELIFKIFLAYLVGSLSGSLLLGRLVGFDIRQHGSGNAGGTNALRTRGLWFALGVVLIDIGKGVVAVAAVPSVPMSFGVDGAVLRATCGVAVIVGHMYPVFFGFRGGKGAAAFVGAAGVMLPMALLPVVGTWALLLITTGYVGLATIVASASFVGCVFWLAPPTDWPTMMPFAMAGTTLVVFAHRSNIRRLLDGTENRFERVRILGRRR